MGTPAYPGAPTSVHSPTSTQVPVNTADTTTMTIPTCQHPTHPTRRHCGQPAAFQINHPNGTTTPACGTHAGHALQTGDSVSWQPWTRNRRAG